MGPGSCSGVFDGASVCVATQQEQEPTQCGIPGPPRREYRRAISGWDQTAFINEPFSVPVYDVLGRCPMLCGGKGQSGLRYGT